MGISIGDSDYGSYSFDDVAPMDTGGGAVDDVSPVEETPSEAPLAPVDDSVSQALRQDAFTPAVETPMAWSDGGAGTTTSVAPSDFSSFRVPQGIDLSSDFTAPAPATEPEVAVVAPAPAQDEDLEAAPPSEEPAAAPAFTPSLADVFGTSAPGVCRPDSVDPTGLGGLGAIDPWSNPWATSVNDELRAVDDPYAAADGAPGELSAAGEPEAEDSPEELTAAEGPEAEAGGEEKLPPALQALEGGAAAEGTLDWLKAPIAAGVRGPSSWLSSNAEQAIQDAVAMARYEAEIDAAARAAYAEPGAVVAADGSVEQAVANANRVADETFGDAKALGQAGEKFAEGFKSFFEKPAVRYGGAGLAGVAGAAVEYHDSTDQTTGGKLTDAGLNGVTQTIFALAAPGTAGLDAALTLGTKYLSGKSGEEVNREWGGFISGNLATGIRAATSLGEAIITKDNTGIDTFNANSLAGKYGKLFQLVSQFGNSEPVRTAGANAIESVVNGVQSGYQGVKDAYQGATNAYDSASNRVSQAAAQLQDLINRFWR